MSCNKNLFSLLYALPAYGFLRRVPLYWNAQVEREYYPDRKHSQMLVCEKALGCTFGALLSPIMFPYWLDHDMSYVEVKLRGLPLDDFGLDHTKPQSLIEHYFVT